MLQVIRGRESTYRDSENATMNIRYSQRGQPRHIVCGHVSRLPQVARAMVRLRPSLPDFYGCGIISQIKQIWRIPEVLQPCLPPSVPANTRLSKTETETTTDRLVPHPRRTLVCLGLVPGFGGARQPDARKLVAMVWFDYTVRSCLVHGC